MSPEFYVVEESLLRAIRDRGIANLIHQTAQFKVDIHLAGGTPLDQQQLGRQMPIEISAAASCTCTRRVREPRYRQRRYRDHRHCRRHASGAELSSQVNEEVPRSRAPRMRRTSIARRVW